jgi:endoglucanase
MLDRLPPSVVTISVVPISVIKSRLDFQFGFQRMSLLCCLTLVLCGSCRSIEPVSPNRLASTPVPVPTDVVETYLLQESWAAYRRQFIQEDGRVIDWEGKGRSTSESQAYAMLRSVLINDPKTFALTLKWGEDNLRRRAVSPPATPSASPSATQPTSTPEPTASKPPVTDQLWAWKWGQKDKTQQANQWGILDQNFASDGDIDALTALILAGRRWEKPEYINLARAKLKDLWELSTTSINGQNYLLPGPKIAFQKTDRLELNPSYFAPYAFRLFAQIDPEHDWASLVSSGYALLDQAATISQKQLPSDWIALSRTTGQVQALKAPSPITSQYGFDAYRVWWRIALDAAWFDAPEARKFLEHSLLPLQQLWETQGKIPAQIDLQGKPLVTYEATSQYGMLYAAWSITNPGLAAEIYSKKIAPRYKKGLWDDQSAYYSQNMAWLGLFPPTDLPRSLLQGP